jgi:uncharacterized membrane protein YdfJ with MMPL/SSD domain
MLNALDHDFYVGKFVTCPDSPQVGMVGSNIEIQLAGRWNIIRPSADKYDEDFSRYVLKVLDVSVYASSIFGSFG